jgi:hypothetical protein
VLTDESPFLAKWKRAAADLGIEVVGPFDLTVPSGAHVQVPVLVRYFGGPEGMLVLSDYELVKDLTDEIVQAGYGFSVMSEPKATEPYLRDVFIEVLSDWGWSGPESEKPVWLNSR